MEIDEIKGDLPEKVNQNKALVEELFGDIDLSSERICSDIFLISSTALLFYIIILR